MTLADQAAMSGHDGQVSSGKPGRPKRRAFTASYKARILGEYDALPDGSAEHGALMRRERLYHSHIEHAGYWLARSIPVASWQLRYSNDC